MKPNVSVNNPLCKTRNRLAHLGLRGLGVALVVMASLHGFSATSVPPETVAQDHAFLKQVEAAGDPTQEPDKTPYWAGPAPAAADSVNQEPESAPAPSADRDEQGAVNPSSSDPASPLAKTGAPNGKTTDIKRHNGAETKHLAAAEKPAQRIPAASEDTPKAIHPTQRMKHDSDAAADISDPRTVTTYVTKVTMPDGRTYTSTKTVTATTASDIEVRRAEPVYSVYSRHDDDDGFLHRLFRGE